MAGGAGSFSAQAAEAELGEAGYTPDAIGEYEAVLEASRDAREEVAAWESQEQALAAGEVPTEPSAVTRAVAGCRLARLDAGPFSEGDVAGAATAPWTLVQGRAMEAGSAAWNLAEAQERQLFDDLGSRLPEGVPAPPESVEGASRAWSDAVLGGPGLVPPSARLPPGTLDVAGLTDSIDPGSIAPDALGDELGRRTSALGTERLQVIAAARSAASAEHLASVLADDRYARAVEDLDARVRARAREAAAATRSASVPRGRADMMARAYERSVAAGVVEPELSRRLQRRLAQESASARSPRLLRAQSAERDLDRARVDRAAVDAVRDRVTGRVPAPTLMTPVRPEAARYDAIAPSLLAEPTAPLRRRGERAG
jgi:hypothetical protein